MINWILIIILVLAGFIAIRFLFSRHAKHRLVMSVMLIAILLFISTFYFVSNSNNIDVTTLSGLGQGAQVYGSWILHSFDNVRVLTGAAVGLDWKDTNTTVPQNISKNISLTNDGKKAGAAVVDTSVKAANSVTEVVKPNTPAKITTYK